MRLWHVDLIPYLPKSQLLAQWRELNSIYAKQDRHILINYIYDYNCHYLKAYSDKVIAEMRRREINIRDFSKYDDYFWGMQNGFAGKEIVGLESGLRFKEHDDEYLRICYYNLKEKYMRGQKDFDYPTWIKLYYFCKNILEKEKTNG